MVFLPVHNNGGKKKQSIVCNKSCLTFFQFFSFVADWSSLMVSIKK